MNYQNLTAAINAVIKTNNRREITGQILQNVLGQMVGSLGENFQLAGLATPLTNPGEPDQNVFYFAKEQGVYSYFDDIQLEGGLHVLKWKNGSWTVDTLTSGIVTREWVESNYVSIAFFRQLFRAYNSNGVEIYPNDTTGIVDNIKAMVGFWTEQYISALGQGSGGGGGGGASALSDLLDVELTTLQNGQALVYSSALGKWTNGTAGVNMTQVWSALGSSTNEQINISHLTGALTPYAETSYVDTQINNTKTWVGQNFITIAFFDRLFQAYEGTGSSATRVNPNDTTSTIDNIKAMFGFWTEQYLSALGQNAGGGGDIVLAEPLQSINSACLGTPQTAGVGLVWNGTSWTYGTIGTGIGTVTIVKVGTISYSPVNGVVSLPAYPTVPTKVSDLTNDVGYTTNIGTVTQVKVGTTAYNPSSGVVSLPAYPTTLPASDVYAWAKASTKPSYSFNEITGSLSSTQMNAGINNLTTSSSTPTDNDYFISQYVGGGTATTSYHRRPISTLWAYISGKGDSRYLSLSGGTVTGTVIFSKTEDAESSSYTAPALVIGGTPDQRHIEIDNNEILSKSNRTTGQILWLNKSLYMNAGSYTKATKGLIVTGERLFGSGDDEGLFVEKGSTGYAGVIVGSTDADRIVLYCSDGSYNRIKSVKNSIVSQLLFKECGLELRTFDVPFIIFNNSDSYVGHIRMKNNNEFYFYKGTTGTSSSDSAWVDAYGFYAYGPVTALSDIRDKDIVDDVSLSIEQIANAPAIRFVWNDGRDDKSMQAGSIAQYWHKVLPEVIREKDDRLSLSYGVAALVSSIITARKVVDHERRIADLERENKELKMKLKIA